MPVRVLHIVTYMGRGGLETMLMNAYRHIDREKLQFDFLVHRDFRADYDDEIESLGGKIYHLPRLNPFSPAYHRELDAFFRMHREYRIVHCHLDCMSAIPLSAAKKAGVPVRIAHSHNSNQDRNWKFILKRLYMRKIPSSASHFFACSQEAGEWMFPGQTFTVIRNGINSDAFSFNPHTRSSLRQALGIDEQLLFGHVGRFAPQKNHVFLITVFHKIYMQNPDARLLLVGDGELRNQIEEQVNQLNLENAVIFVGSQANTAPYYQAMDLFILPSLYEGLPLVLVEAQASGLPCVISDQVSPECMITQDLVSVQNLDASPVKWADHILRRTCSNRISHAEEVKARGYDITETAKWLETFYLRNGGA